MNVDGLIYDIKGACCNRYITIICGTDVGMIND